MDNIQTELFSRIKAAMPVPGLMPDQLADLLQISKDSVYRRIKGEKPLLFDEIVTIAKAFHISLDEIMNLSSESIVFHGQYVNEGNFNLEHYVGSMIQNLQSLSVLENVNLYYISKDIPVFYYLMFPEIAAFKFFVWAKTQMQFEHFKDRVFSFDIVTAELADLCKKAAQLYASQPSVEILNADNILNDLRQLEYYKDTNVFNNRDEIDCIYDKMDEMVAHMENQAVSGHKSLPGQADGGGDYKLYVNDFYVGDNTVIASSNSMRIVFLNHAAINFVSTVSPNFVDYNIDFMNNLIKKSALISEVGERTRSRFFNLIHERIARHRLHTMHSFRNS
jgi:hypothetical protein